MAQILADHPSIPFEHHIHGGFSHGKTLTIRGRAEYHRSGDETFIINFGVDPDHHSNIALHLSFRHKEKKLVLNTMVAGDWGKEEKHANKIDAEQHFELKIAAHDKHYHIEINGHHVGEFKHRIPSPLVNHIDIEGGVHIETIELESH